MTTFKIKNMIFIKGGLQYKLQSFYTEENLDKNLYKSEMMMIYIPVNLELQPEVNIWKAKNDQARF